MLQSALATSVTRVQHGIQSILSVVIAAVVAYAFGALDSLGNALLASYLSDALGGACAIGELGVFLVAGTAEAEGFAMAQPAHFPGGKALEIAAAKVAFCPGALARERKLVVTEASLGDVSVVVSRHASGAVNFGLADKRKREAFYAAHPKGVAAEAPVLRVDEPPSPKADDDWVEVPGGEEAPRRDFFDRAGEGPTLDRGEENPLEVQGKRLWGLLRTKVAEQVSTRVEAATHYEKTLRSQRRRSSIEDLALEALDFGRSLNDAAGEIYEDQSARALALAKKTARDTLTSALDAALDDDEESQERTMPPIRVAVAGPVAVERLRLALISADGTALLDPPLAFEACRVVVEAADDDAHPAVVLRGVLKALLRRCLDDLIEHRPEDARRLAVALGEEAKKEAASLAQAKIAEHFPKTSAKLKKRSPPPAKSTAL